MTRPESSFKNDVNNLHVQTIVVSKITNNEI